MERNRRLTLLLELGCVTNKKEKEKNTDIIFWPVSLEFLIV